MRSLLKVLLIAVQISNECTCCSLSPLEIAREDSQMEDISLIANFIPVSCTGHSLARLNAVSHLRPWKENRPRMTSLSLNPIYLGRFAGFCPT